MKGNMRTQLPHISAIIKTMQKENHAIILAEMVPATEETGANSCTFLTTKITQTTNLIALVIE